MVKWAAQMIAALGWTKLLLGFALFFVTLVGSFAVVAFVLVRLPADYFHPANAREFWSDRHKAVRWAGMAAKNLAGAALVLLGIVMSLPGVPGQGVLTILLGVMLLDFPGKREWERRIVSRPRVFGSINRLRARFSKPPLLLD